MKQEFDFYLDEKVKVWNRFKFSVEAETLEEAKQKAIYMATKNREELEFWDSEILGETFTEIEPEENDGQPTIEIYCRKSDELLYDNSNAEIWANTNRKNYIIG